MHARPKKRFGQHFLTDHTLAARIVHSLTGKNYKNVLEVGPGKGILTRVLMEQNIFDWKCVEIDEEMVQWLINHLNIPREKIIQEDFLKLKLDTVWNEPFAILGNFPYNISTQIIFHILHFSHLIPEVVGMFQREVAVRLASDHNSRNYGLTSVLVQLFYNVKILFHIQPGSFFPPPQVMSSVVIFTRKNSELLPDLQFHDMLRFLKKAFSQRRKILKNAFPELFHSTNSSFFEKWKNLRPEQIPVSEYKLMLENYLNPSHKENHLKSHK